MAAIENEVYVGSLTNPTFYFQNDEIVNIQEEKNVSLVAEELQIDTMTAKVVDTGTAVELFSPTDYTGIIGSDSQIFSGTSDLTIMDLTYGEPIWFYSAGNLEGKFYVKTVKRTSKQGYTIEAESIIGFLDSQYFGGGVYSGTTFSTILNDIIGDAFEYTVDDEIGTQQVYGWIPYCTKREALHQLMFAYCVNLFKDSTTGNAHFTWANAGDAAIDIPDTRIYNEGSYSYSDTPSRIDITEHIFINSTSESTVELFSSSDDGFDSDHRLVKWNNAPIVVSSIKSTGSIVFNEKHENYGIITGNGTITGRPYSHTTRVISKENPDAEEDNVKSVTDATLVTMRTSEFLVDKLYEYYMETASISNAIVVSGEDCGNQYKFLDPFEEETTAFLTKMTINSSGILKSSCTFIPGYSPTPGGYMFKNVVILTSTSQATFTTPTKTDSTELVDKMTVVIIGGGQGGQGGSAGEDGSKGQAHISGVYVMESTGGDGGAGGSAGSGGKVYTVTIENPSPSYTYKCGYGGNGTEAVEHGSTAEEGIKGTDSVFGSYSSNYGETYDGGIIDYINGIVYGAKGLDGADGTGGGKYNIAGSSAEMPQILVWYRSLTEEQAMEIDPDTEHAVGDAYKEYYKSMLLSNLHSVEYDGVIYESADDGELVLDDDNSDILQKEDVYPTVTSDSIKSQELTYAGIAYGGFGGGTSPGGGAGTPGGDSSIDHNYVFRKGTIYAKTGTMVSLAGGGNGGNGINQPDQSIYGSGGNGGCGGGGGGDTGSLGAGGNWQQSHYWSYEITGDPGTGGSGGAGGKGGDGVILVYY